MIDLYKLDIFVQVVEEGSFSAAAARLLMTQSGVSQHIQELERNLGAVLFRRSPRGVRLTPAGQTLYDYARRIFALVAEAEAAVSDVTLLPSGQVNVGATPGVSIYVLAEWVQRFAAAYPNLTVNVQTEITPRIVEALLARRLDIGLIEGELTPAQTAQLEVRELEPIDQFVVVGSRHPFWTRREVALAELDGQRFIMRQRESQTRIWLDAALAQHGIRPRIGAEFDTVESIKRAVIAGPALTILPAYAVHDEQTFGLLRALPITGSPLQRTLKLIWDRRRPFSPVTRAFLRYLVERFPALAELAHL
ncbi:MAG TPA: LysR family transcriptional regulator [Caldilineaceae bacterium]|nr:LysR family transcriptional regulator [Caldilineaceae bacterium]